MPPRKKLKPVKGLLKSARSDSAYNKVQLERGTKVEMEHTRNKKTAKRITKHHLDEHPDYYKELYKMEKKLERENR